MLEDYARAWEKCMKIEVQSRDNFSLACAVAAVVCGSSQSQRPFHSVCSWTGGAGLPGTLSLSLYLSFTEFLGRGARDSDATLEKFVPVPYFKGFFTSVEKSCACGINVFGHAMFHVMFRCIGWHRRHSLHVRLNCK